MTTAFFGLIPIEESTGQALFNAVKDCLEEYGVELKNCIGYACYGATNIVGRYNSLWSRIETESTNWIQLP